MECPGVDTVLNVRGVGLAVHAGGQAPPDGLPDAAVVASTDWWLPALFGVVPLGACRALTRVSPLYGRGSRRSIEAGVVVGQLL